MVAGAGILVSIANLHSSEFTKKRVDWTESFKGKYDITAEKDLNDVQQETSLVFAKVLEHTGVFARIIEGRAAFLQFLTTM